MKVVLLNGRVFDCDVAPDELWVVFNLVKGNAIEAVVRRRNSNECFNMRIVDADKTFGDLIRQGYKDTLPPDAA